MKRLAQLLQAKREEILERWCRAVLADTNVPAAKTISTPALRDHVPQIVDAIIEALEGGLADGEAAQGRALATSKMPRIHAEERFDEGYSLAALLRELSHLRASIVDAYWSEQPLDPRGVRFLHAAVPSARPCRCASGDEAPVRHTWCHSNARTNRISWPGSYGVS